MITKPTCIVVSTTRLLNTLGKMCFSIRRKPDAPATLARAMKSADLTDSVIPRAVRALCVQSNRTSTMMTVPKLVLRAATNASASRMIGMDRDTPTALIISASGHLPKNPAPIPKYGADGPGYEDDNARRYDRNPRSVDDAAQDVQSNLVRA